MTRSGLTMTLLFLTLTSTINAQQSAAAPPAKNLNSPIERIKVVEIV